MGRDCVKTRVEIFWWDHTPPSEYRLREKWNPLVISSEVARFKWEKAFARTTDFTFSHSLGRRRSFNDACATQRIIRPPMGSTVYEPGPKVFPVCRIGPL